MDKFRLSKFLTVYFIPPQNKIIFAQALAHLPKNFPFLDSKIDINIPRDPRTVVQKAVFSKIQMYLNYTISLIPRNLAISSGNNTLPSLF